MKKILNTIGILVLVLLLIFGAFAFGHELKKAAELKEHRAHVRFERDSLQVEIYKKQLLKHP